MPRLTFTLCLILSLLYGVHAQADPRSPEQRDEHTPDVDAEGQPIRSVKGTVTPQHESSFILLPVAAYSPETSVLFSALGIFFFDSGATRPARGHVVLTYTLRNQARLDIGGEIPFAGDRFQLRGFGKAISWNDRFYGVGNDAPTDWQKFESEEYELRLDFMSRLWLKGLYAGLAIETFKSVIYDDPDSRLRTSGLIGTQGGVRLGAGALIEMDRREGTSTLTPTGGYLLTLRYNAFDSKVAGDFTYSRFVMDARSYLPLWGWGLLASQLRASFTGGQTPFDDLGLLGGDQFGRGIFRGRYRDRHSVVLQTGWRTPTWGNWGGAVFGSVGEVSPDVATFPQLTPRWTLGTGLRYFLDLERGISIRFDMGFNADDFGAYVNIGEAF
ncbi:MAG: hypothetical protein ACE366_17215 [Bradymonadia bacterium]